MVHAVTVWLRPAASWSVATATRLWNSGEAARLRVWPVLAPAAAAVGRGWAKVAPLLAVAIGKVREVIPANVLRARSQVLQIGASVAAVVIAVLAIGGVVATTRHAPRPAASAAALQMLPAPRTTVATPPSAAGTPDVSAAPGPRKAATPEARSTTPKAPDKTKGHDSGTPGEPGPEYGIDVSNHNGDINWNKVAANGKRFAYVLATDGEGFTNPLFKSQFNGARDAGLLVGAYHFARPSGSASDQADFLLSTIDYHSDGKTLPPELDLEVNPADGGCYGLSPGQMQDWVKAFNARVKQETGMDAVLYANSSFWNQCMGGTDAFKSTNPLSLAMYGSGSPSSPGGWDHYTIWQNSQWGRVNGVDGDVDLDVFNGGLDQLRKFTRH
jgi:lysozyme